MKRSPSCRCKSEPPTQYLLFTNAPSFRKFAQLGEINKYGMKTLHKMMRKGALVMTNTLK
jgi:hypothetical protein